MCKSSGHDVTSHSLEDWVKSNTLGQQRKLRNDGRIPSVGKAQTWWVYFLMEVFLISPTMQPEILPTIKLQIRARSIQLFI